ncbi:AMP-binding protein [Alicyclobacillus sp. SO9]|uniref:AMP-binding protein n=1 Tax=Alicyclobacillus sp. SO9 TaxID=2665646 RepID=UPI0018E7BFB4|nr:AMP-binding protein [Alicyclobacillus sp. SO9]QQE79084.1 AMP-binding protein [Alicyclobacillus sp. SO9]
MRNWVVHEVLQDAAWQHPNVEVVSPSKRFTYAQSWERVIRLANSLRNLGIGKGTVVGVLDVNSYRYFELQHALSIAGAVVHTINFRLPLDDLVYTVDHAGDEIVFAWEGFEQAGRALQSHVRKVIWMLDSYEDLIESGSAVLHEHGTGPTDTFSIFYTTGTTGRPKGIRYRHQDMLLASLQIAHHLAIHDTGAKLQTHDTIMPLIPFFHIHGWGTPFFAPYLGAKLVLPETADASAQLELIRNEGVTWSNMVPTQLHMLLQALSEHPSSGGDSSGASTSEPTLEPTSEPTSDRPAAEGTNPAEAAAATEDTSGVANPQPQLPLHVLTGGSPLPSGIAQRATNVGIQFSLIYGGSDQLATSISAIQTSTGTKQTDRLHTLSTRTLPLPMVRVDVRDVHERSVPRDGQTIGEVWVQSPWLPDGYVRDETRSREVFIDGWFKTGDLAVWHKDGSLHVLDRQKDAVKSGGEWIATSVIEAIISELDEVAMVAVLAEQSEQWGERPMAVIQLDKADDSSTDVGAESGADVGADVGAGSSAGSGVDVETERATPDSPTRAFANESGSTDSRSVFDRRIRNHLYAAVEQGRLAKFWVPDRILFVDSIPVTSAGKIHKSALRKTLEEK